MRHRVLAYNAAGNSTPSNEACEMTLADGGGEGTTGAEGSDESIDNSSTASEGGWGGDGGGTSTEGSDVGSIGTASESGWGGGRRGGQHRWNAGWVPGARIIQRVRMQHCRSRECASCADGCAPLRSHGRVAPKKDSCSTTSHPISAKTTMIGVA